MKNFKVLIIVLIGAALTLSLLNAGNRTEITNVTVKKLVAQNLVSGSSDNLATEIRYLVVTNKGIFLCESSILNGKFNNSEIFYSLKEDSTYTKFVTVGIRKTMLSDYPNLISVE